MSERNTMKTFFAAMNGQIGMGGYGSKIKSTPMGAFKWNDLMQLWENVNNGMIMNNVSLQDMMAMDYETLSGDTGKSAVNYTPTLTPADWGNLQTMDNGVTEYWASTTGAQLLLANGTAVTFSGLGASISVTLAVSTISGISPGTIKYSLNGAAAATYSTALTISNTNTLKIGGISPGGFGNGIGNIVVTNATTSTVLYQIPYGISIE